MHSGKSNVKGALAVGASMLVATIVTVAAAAPARFEPVPNHSTLTVITVGTTNRMTTTPIETKPCKAAVVGGVFEDLESVGKLGKEVSDVTYPKSLPVKAILRAAPVPPVSAAASTRPLVSHCAVATVGATRSVTSPVVH